MDKIAKVFRIIGLQSFTQLIKNLISKHLITEIRILVDDNVFFGSVDDRAFLYKIKNNNFEKETIDLLNKVIKPGMNFVDVGAYIGFYSINISKILKNTGMVYSYEPNPYSFKLLSKNIYVNNIKNINAYQLCVSNNKNKCIFYTNKKDPSRSSTLREESSEEEIIVECIRLDNHLKNKRIDCIKIDVEGMEISVLKGMEKLIEKSDKLLLIIENNPIALKKNNFSHEELFEILQKFNFKIISELDKSYDASGVIELSNLYCTKI